jgi:hypothetical protein
LGTRGPALSTVLLMIAATVCRVLVVIGIIAWPTWRGRILHVSLALLVHMWPDLRCVSRCSAKPLQRQPSACAPQKCRPPRHRSPLQTQRRIVAR